MGIADRYAGAGRTLVERPVALAAVLAGALLVADLIRRVTLVQGPGALAPETLGIFLWRGLVNGLIIGLAGIGLSMTYSILNFANFAHGDYISTGAFAGWATTWVVAGLGKAQVGVLVLLGLGGSVFSSDLGTGVPNTPLAVVIGIVIAGAFTAALALVLDRIVYKPMRGEEGISLLIASIGVAFALRYLLVFVFGSAPRKVVQTPENLTLGGATLWFDTHQAALVVCSVALMGGVHLLLQRTKLGKSMRAMADNEDLARITGIPTERVVQWTWVIGAALAGIGGYLLILESGTIAFNRGWILLLLIFAAVIMGGIGSVYGAIAGGLLIGVADTLSQVWLPSDFTRAAAFLLMILILIVRPQGIFAGRSTA
jgi:branched-chain amino acid transport system permease protein